MSFDLFSDDEINIQVKKSLEEDEKKKDELYSCVECYSCTQCSSNIEIQDLDEKNNILSFNCTQHGITKISIKEYLELMGKNTYLYTKGCFYGEQKKNKNDCNFKYYSNCKKFLSNNYINNHDKNHYKIGNNILLENRSLYPKNENKRLCFESNKLLFDKCLKEKEQTNPKIIKIKEINISNKDIINLLKFDEYKKKLNDYKNKKNFKINELLKNYNKIKEKIKNEYNLLELKNKFNLDIKNNIKKKFEKKEQLIKDKSKEKGEKNINKLKEKLEILKNIYKNEINENINIFNKGIEKYSELFRFNNIIYNTYNKYKNNNYYKINLDKLLEIYNKNKKIIFNGKENEENLIKIKNKDKTHIEINNVFKDIIQKSEQNNPFEELEKDYPIGLDIGNNYCRICVYRNGGVEMIPNANGKINTPSIIFILDKNEFLIGEEALNYLESNYEEPISEIKSYIGREYNEIYEKINIDENLPFKIIEDINSKKPLISIINKNNKVKIFTFEELLSFIIRKMIDNAETYLNTKINKLVITVPCNFNDSQKSSIKKAANLAGVNIIRIISESIAAALAYNNANNIYYSKDNEPYKRKKILILDLGGRNAKVTILKTNYENNEKFEILSYKEDKFLGGDNINNKLIDYFLNKFCEKYILVKENIRKDKKAIKKLKIVCEKIKKFLSTKNNALLKIVNFYEQKDIFECITRSEFINICNEIFGKLKNFIKEALNDAKVNKDEINEIILVGGTSKIQKIEILINEIFGEIIINDSIDPDIIISYGATLMAKNILHKSSKNLNSNLIDFVPYSLGINIKNESKNPEIIKEGDLMKVIIKRGEKIPCTTIVTYKTYEINKKELKINIFEGEKKYVKHNNLLGEILIKNLSKKSKEEFIIYLNFFIDINGILTITVIENFNLYQIEIKNDMGLLDHDIIKIKNKYKEFLHKKISKDIDNINIKEILKKIKKAYEESKENDEKYEILKFYIEILEDFVNLFNKKNINEALLEKYFIITKELIILIIEYLNMKDKLTKEENIKNITNQIIKNILFFININSGYLDDLLEIMKKLPKTFYFEIVIMVIEKLIELGKNYLKERNIRRLAYFEKAYLFFKKYAKKPRNFMTYRKDIKEIWRNKLLLIISYLNSINENEIPINKNYLISKNFSISENLSFAIPLIGLKLNIKDEMEKYNIILKNYENILLELSDKICKEKAICIANILNINIKYLGNFTYSKYYKLGKDCEFIVTYLKLDKNEYWYIEFNEIFQDIEENYLMMENNENIERIRIKEKYKEIFEEIELQFLMRKNDFEFIQYILYSHPYEGYEKELKIKDFSKFSIDLIDYLRDKYNPCNYNYLDTDEESLLKYFIDEVIKIYLDEINYNFI